MKTMPLYVREALNGLDEIMQTAKPGAGLQKEALALSIALQTGATIPGTYRPKFAATATLIHYYWIGLDAHRHIDAQIAAMKVEIRERNALLQAILARVNANANANAA